MREAHKILRGSSRSDALSAMAALLAFEEADRSPAFAAASGLHFRHLQEAAALRRQLAHYLSRSRPEWRLAELLPPVQPPHPSNLIVDMLRRGAAAGWADQVHLHPALMLSSPHTPSLIAQVMDNVARWCRHCPVRLGTMKQFRLARLNVKRTHRIVHLNCSGLYS